MTSYFQRVAGGLAALLLLSGCIDLPTSGPTAKRIEKAARSPENKLNFALVEITPQSLPPEQDLFAAAETTLGAIGVNTPLERSDAIRPGDALAIAIYEVGVTLFGNTLAQLAGPADVPTANAQQMVALVDEDGRITLPYLGSLRVAGMTPLELANQIETRLRPYSQSPQAMVAIRDTLENNAILSGAIARPGRFRLTSARERLLDVIAIAGGAQGNSADMDLRVVRGSRVASVRLADLRPESKANIVVAPGDRIELIRLIRSYTVFGATEKVAQYPFESNTVSLAEAIARANGPSDQRANARGIFLFRFEDMPNAAARPVVYRLNMLDPTSYFLAQHIPVRDKDVILFSSSPSNLTSKFINLLNQLSSPIVTGIVVAR